MATLEQRVIATYKQRTGRLIDASTLDLLRAWGILDSTRLDRTFPAWIDAVMAIYANRGEASRELAHEFYAALRAASGVGGPTVVAKPKPLPVATFRTDMKIKVLIGIKDAMTAGRAVDDAMKAAFVNSTGRTIKHLLDLGRQEVIDLGQADAAVARWSRVTSGGCDFCQMLAGKGAVFYESSADFAAHDHCQCAAVPEFGSGSKSAREYAGRTRDRSQEERDLLREYLSDNYGRQAA